MAYSVASRNTAIDAVAATARWISLHTGDPGVTGANEIVGGVYGREQTTYPAAANGTTTGSNVIIDVPGGTNGVTYWGSWSAPTGGTFQAGGQLLSGGNPVSESFGGNGTYTLAPTLDSANVV